MRHRTKRAVVATLVLATAWTAPAAAQYQSPSATPAPTVTATPTPEATPTQVLQAPLRVGPPELHLLAGILASADGEIVVLRVPGSATIDASEGDLVRLAEAAKGARFFVVQQGDARLDGAAAILSAFAIAGFRQPGSDEASGDPGNLWPAVERLTGCADPCPPSLSTSQAPWVMDLDRDSPAIEADLAASQRPLAEVLDEPAPDGGGIGVNPLVVLVLMLTVGGVTAAALGPARRRRADQAPRLAASPSPSPPEDIDPEPAGPDPGPPAPRAPAPSGRARRARVVSALDPEGYVELDRCLRRVRWASTGTPPAAPGEWVDVETRGRRLWAYAAARPIAPRPRGRATQRRETQP